MQNTETLTSLAMLRVNADEGRDYVEYLTPFVSYVLSHANPDPVTDAGTQALLQSEFGLVLPKHAVTFVLGRLAKRRILQRDHGIYHIIGSFKNENLDQKRAMARRQQSVVVNNLMSFAKQEHGLEWNEQQTGDAIVSYLSRFSLEFLKTFTRGSALPELPSPTETQVFVVSTFVKHIYDYSSELFDGFVNLVKGHMLANALLCEDLESLQRKFDGLTVYFDTPFVMRLLRFWGPAQYEAAIELLDLLVRLRAKLAIFDHTTTEVMHVIQFCEANLENPKAASHEMIASLRREGFRVSDLAVTRNNLAEVFKSQGIVVRNAPPHLPKFEIDEAKLEATISDEIRYFSPRARQNDIDSIRSVYTLRENRHPFRLEDAAAVLVTTNNGLVRAAFNYGKKHESGSEVSTVITDFSLANIAWLKAPLGAPDLPRLEVIADCFAALEPPPGLWSRYVEEIDKLEERGSITADEHEVLKQSVKARDELMNLTLGSEGAFSAGTVTTILSRVKAEMVREKDAELTKERHERLAETSELEAGRSALTTELATLREETERRKSLQQKRAFWMASRIGLVVQTISFWVLVILLIASAAVASALVPRISAYLWVRVGLVMLLLFGVLFAILNGIHGITAKSLSKAVGRWCEVRALSILNRWLLVDEPSEVGSQEV